MGCTVRRPWVEVNSELFDNMVFGTRGVVVIQMRLLFASRLIEARCQGDGVPALLHALLIRLLSHSQFAILRVGPSFSEDPTVVKFQDEFYRCCQMHARATFSA